MLNINNIILDGYIPYKFSFRPINNNRAICIVKKNNQKFICIKNKEKITELTEIIKEYKEENTYISIFKMNWDNYNYLKNTINIHPQKINKKASIGISDIMDCLATPHIRSLSKYDVYPILCQKSPNEIKALKQSYKSSLINTVMGILENGYDGNWGADANNIFTEDQLKEALDAEYSMYTIDLSHFLTDKNIIENNFDSLKKGLSETSNQIIKEGILFSNLGYHINEESLNFSACYLEEGLNNILSYYNIIKTKIKDFDLEISLINSNHNTTLEDYLYINLYLQKNHISYTGISPKIDYNSINIIEKFKSISENFNNKKLSLHLGYENKNHKELTKVLDNNYHFKIKEISWFNILLLTSLKDQQLFEKIIKIINRENNIKINLQCKTCINNPELCKIFLNNYNIIINELNNELKHFISVNEKDLYFLIQKNIDKHLKN